MTLDPQSESRLSAIYPFLADKIRALADSLDFKIIVVQGLRTYEQQDALYAIGRTKPGKIVTNARGGFSWHNFGLAVDVAPLNKDGSVNWDGSHPQWKALVLAAVKLGLTSGANWKRLVDEPHLQYTRPFPENAPNDEVRELFKTGGLQAVWDSIVTT